MIQPQVSMPVLYHPKPDDHFGGATPLAATIASVLIDGSGRWVCNLSVLDPNGLIWSRTAVPFHAGSGNANELYGVHGGFCEFPGWFIKLMGPPLFVVNPGPVVGLTGPAVDWSDPKLSAAAAPAVHTTVAGLAGAAYNFHGCGDARCNLCGCIPTSQVLG